jgi:uncharacterized membrane protein
LTGIRLRASATFVSSDTEEFRVTPDPGLKQETIQTVSGKDQIRDQDKVHLFLSYFGIFALIPLLTVKDSPYVQWHAKQGIAVVAAAFGLGILSIILGFIPGIRMVAPCFLGLAQLALWVVDIIAMIKAFNGERWKIPVVSQIAEKF